MRAIRVWGLMLLIVVAAGCATTGRDDRTRDRTHDRTHERPSESSTADTVDTKAQQCIALAMYWEAGGEGRDGMLAVGSVILNRVADHRFPKTPCGVVFEGGETPPCQFSWWCDGKSDRPTNGSIWAQALSTARELLIARPSDATGGALFFHSTSIRNPWRRERTAQIGNHVFYR